MPILKITGGDKTQVDEKTAKTIRELKYGKDGSMPSDPGTPVSVPNLGTIELKDIRMILNDEIQIRDAEEFDWKTLKEKEKEYKDNGGFDSFCENSGYIKKDADGKWLVNKETLPAYNREIEIHKQVRDNRRKKDYAIQQSAQ